MAEELLIPVEEAARRLAIGRTVAYSLIRSGELPSVKIGRSRRIPVSTLQQYVESLRDREGEDD